MVWSLTFWTSCQYSLAGQLLCHIISANFYAYVLYPWWHLCMMPSRWDVLAPLQCIDSKTTIIFWNTRVHYTLLTRVYYRPLSRVVARYYRALHKPNSLKKTINPKNTVFRHFLKISLKRMENSTILAKRLQEELVKTLKK